MSVVVDTNVVAYYLLGTEPFTEEVGGFWLQARTVSAPSSWSAELTNVIWMAVRTDALSLEQGQQHLSLASRLGIRSVPPRTLWHRALTLAVQSGVAAYDTLFVALAQREKVPLVTLDAQVLKAFPDVAIRPGEALAS